MAIKKQEQLPPELDSLLQNYRTLLVNINADMHKLTGLSPDQGIIPDKLRLHPRIQAYLDFDYEAQFQAATKKSTHKPRKKI